MTPLVRDLLINGLMAGTAVRTAKKTSAGMGYFAIAGSIGIIALVFFAIAFYGFLLEAFSMPAAAALTGLAILGFSLCFAVAGYMQRHHKKPAKKSHHDGGLIDTVEDTIKSLMGGFEEPIKDNPKMAMLLAALAGFAAGDQLGDTIDRLKH